MGRIALSSSPHLPASEFLTGELLFATEYQGSYLKKKKKNVSLINILN
jgi:hypothetical protein